MPCSLGSVCVEDSQTQAKVMHGVVQPRVSISPVLLKLSHMNPSGIWEHHTSSLPQNIVIHVITI